MNSFFDMKSLLSQIGPLQKYASKWESTLKNITAKSETGGGMVKVVVNGEGHLIDLVIDTQLLEKDEIVVLPRLIKEAINDAQTKVKQEVNNKLKDLATELPFNMTS